MLLHIYLKNDKDSIKSIESALKSSDSFAFIENDEIIIENTTIIKEYINLYKENFSDAQSMTKDYLNSINGLAKLYSVSIPVLKTKLILFKHENGTWLPVPIGATVNANFMIGSPPSISKHVKASSTSEHIAKAMRIYSQDINWANLYKICEIIKEDGYILPNKQLKAITVSANKSYISGDDARHGGIMVKGKPPKNTTNINDATAFVIKHMKLWLKNSTL